ncbi:hypothetical protein ACLKA6_011477 [Drosophila palustris]
MALNAACSCVLALVIVLCSTLPAAIEADYPGVIELVGYSNRRARTHFMETPSFSPNPTLTPPASKTRADIETVKRNMKKYDRLLELDTKNLPEPQKDMLARIVERVARLKETLDIEEQQLIQQEATSARSSSSSSSSSSSTQQLSIENAEQSTVPTTGYTETETDPTLLLDETTLLELQNTMNEQAALQAEVTAQTTLMREMPTTTDLNLDVTNSELAETTAPALTTLSESREMTNVEDSKDNVDDESTTESFTDATDADDQFVAARSNNNIAAITAADSDTTTTTTTAGNQRTLTTMGKLKIRATKRPFGHKVTAALKRQGQRPSSVSAAAANAAAASKPPSNTATTSKQKLSNNNNYQKLTTNKQQQKLTTAGSTQNSNPATITPALPLEQLYTRTPQANIPVPAAAAATAAVAAAAVAPVASNYNNNSNAPDAIVYDGHVNASALIDSLNTHAREEYYQQKLNSNSNNNKQDNKKNIQVQT